MATPGKWLFRFAVITDAHVADVEESTASPFPVGRLTSSRYRYVINLLNEHDVDFILNLGDMVNPLPSLPTYDEAARRFHEISRPLKHKQYFIPGNHDIGDKPSGWMPADPVNQQALDLYRKYFGPDRQLFEHNGCVFILLNAELLNAALPEAEQQRHWLESALREHDGRRIMMAIHYPPFLCNADEFDHYDNIAEPGRSWLLGLLARHNVEAVFSGHVHNFWLNRWVNTNLYVVPSLVFPRQDYSEMYATEPEPEGGRNDPDKLGFMTVDMYENDHVWRLHRTFGARQLPDDTYQRQRRPSTVLPGETALQNVGLDMRQSWITFHQVPPSGALDEFYRKEVRNDYPLLAINDLGVRDLRIPLNDLLDERVRNRLFDLKGQALRLTVYCFGLPEPAACKTIVESRELLDRIEIVWPEKRKTELRSAMASLKEELALPILISPLWAEHGKMDTQGRHLHVINHGFPDAGPEMLLEFFCGTPPSEVADGAVFWLDVDGGFLKEIEAVSRLAKEQEIEAHVIARITGANPAEWQDDERWTATGSVIAQLAAVMAPNVRIYLDAFLDVDRGYYRRAGLIDKQCNPRAAWHAMRALRSELHTAPEVPGIKGPIAFGKWSLYPVRGKGMDGYVACFSEAFEQSELLPEGLTQAGNFKIFDLCTPSTPEAVVAADQLGSALSEMSTASAVATPGPYFLTPSPS